MGTVELAERLGIRDMVVHCGSKSNPDVPREAAFDLAGDTLQTVGEAARRAGIATVSYTHLYTDAPERAISIEYMPI